MTSMASIDTSGGFALAAFCLLVVGAVINPISGLNNVKGIQKNIQK